MRIEPAGGVRTREKRRRQVRKSVTKIPDTSEAPTLEAARRLSRLQPFNEKKVLIHGQERASSEQNTHYDARVYRSIPDSSWDFDRIVCYLIVANTRDADWALPVLCTRQELERLEPMIEQDNLIALHHAVGSVGAASSCRLGIVTRSRSSLRLSRF